MKEVYNKDVSFPACYSIYIWMKFPIYWKRAILMTQLFSQMVHHYAVYSCWWYSFILKQCYWSLNKPKLFQQYWKKWKLSINPKKIKIMIFEKRSQINAWEIFLFLIDNDPIEISQD